MNRYISLLGVIFILLSAFLFFVDFNGGHIGALVITDGIPIANFAAFLFAIIFLPVGSGLAFFGFSYRGSVYAAGTPSTSFASSGLAKAILAVAIIAVVVGAVSLAAVVAVDSSISGISSKTAVSTVTVAGPTVTTTATSGGAGVNVAPSTDFYRIDWCNTDNTGQDRYCPSQIVVNQGDTVVILFEHNDTDAHTFTITATYSFQINATFGMSGMTNISGTLEPNGMHNFVTNGIYNGSCVNTSSFSQQSSGLSASLCVSGSSLLSPLGTVAFVNPTPGAPLNPTAPNGGLVALNDTNSVVFQEPGGNMSIAYSGGNCSAPACTNPETGAPSSAMTWGIAAFQATTPGTYEYFCHYHVSNGMFGYITVLPNAYCSSHASSCGISNSTSTT
jgi:plastocyanin